eukprot:TRINITY_DN6819_c0_g1_i1.p1 TRINITY_DN6819_c0_g1~~TRINITY_DN6819_c0_g1_i1.p1  ORF type:complete len:843 (+),score=248.75 TRINITY_DN6819_c0_g1_i1:104-2632(+)
MAGETDATEAPRADGAPKVPTEETPAAKVVALERRLGELRGQLKKRPACQRTKDQIAVVLVDIGTNLKFSGRAPEAPQKYLESLEFNNRYAPAYYNLGVCAADAGDMQQAHKCYNMALEHNPCCVEALCNLGVIMKGVGDPDGAIVYYRRALRVSPTCDVVLANLAAALNDCGTRVLQMGNRGAAIGLYQESVMAKPDYAEAYYNLGVAYSEQNMLQQSTYFYLMAVHFKPGYAEAWNNLGIVYRMSGVLDRAMVCFEKALDLSNHTFVQTMNSLALLYAMQGRLDPALKLLRKAVELEPMYAEAHNNLGVILRDEGNMHDALACYDRCLAITPQAENAAQNKLLALNFSDEHTLQQIQDAHLSWGRRILQQYGDHDPRPHTNDRALPRTRPLKVGYVSPDFYLHSVSYFSHHLLRHHDSARVEVHCFSNTAQADSKTFAFRRLVPAERWHDVTGKDAKTCAEFIRSLQIDILVDLTGHTASCRLDIFALKPAPVQVSWIGYPNTTGLSTIDYRITDPQADPAFVQAEHYAETLYRLPETFICYCPDTREYYDTIGEAPEPGRGGGVSTKAESFQTGPELLESEERYALNYRGDLAAHVAVAPHVDNGYVTFGCFNNMAKINPHVARVWAAILKQVPDCRLLLKSKPFAEERVREQMKAMLSAEGADLSRVELVGLVPFHYNHLQYYERLDVALDCFPYAGTTTSCEALWMGVPMVTLRGEAHATNVGASLLTSIGIPELIAGTPAEYVDIAVKLAKSPERLREYRSEMRRKMALSPLCDGKRYVRNVEAAFADMWEYYAKGGRKATGAPGYEWSPPRPAPECFLLDTGSAQEAPAAEPASE